MDAVVRLLSELVAIPSVNPMGRPPSGDIYLEGRLTDFLERWLGDRGITCRREVVSPGRENLLARYEAPGASRTILFDVHQDTVPVDGMTIPPFEPTIAGGRLHGRGSCDVKGSMAAMLAAFDRLVRERPTGSASVILACTVDEEYTHTGSSRLATSRHGADLAIVAEPTRLDLVTCHKGALRWKVRSHGVACHSSTPHLGANAIYRMAHALLALEGYAETLSRTHPHPMLGPPSLSVGRIEGGLTANIVPDRCEIEIDRPLLPGEDASDCIEEVRVLLDRIPGGAEAIEFGEPWVHMPALAPRAEAWIAPLSIAIEEATGRHPEIRGVPFGTDAGPLAEAGTPCVVLGPGDIAQAHTKDEWIEIEQVQLAAEMYYRIARDLGRA